MREWKCHFDVPTGSKAGYDASNYWSMFTTSKISRTSPTLITWFLWNQGISNGRSIYTEATARLMLTCRIVILAVIMWERTVLSAVFLLVGTATAAPSVLQSGKVTDHLVDLVLECMCFICLLINMWCQRKWKIEHQNCSLSVMKLKDSLFKFKFRLCLIILNYYALISFTVMKNQSLCILV